MAILLGSHVSMSGGLIGAAQEAYSYGSDTFMIYTGAPQNTIRKPLEQLKIQEGQLFMKENGLIDLVVHAPYIINLASYKPEIYQLAQDFLKKEIERTIGIGSRYLVLHPGSFTDNTLEYGTERIITALNSILSDDLPLTLCLETMAGKGSEIGRTFEELQSIISGVTHNSKLGICFDTCHTHDSGYDIVNQFDQVIQHFDSVIGIDRLKVFHINGSLNPMGAKKDRHANLGADLTNPKGKDFISFEAIHRIVHHSVCQGKPLILETPWLDGTTNLYKEEISRLRGPL